MKEILLVSFLMFFSFSVNAFLPAIRPAAVRWVGETIIKYAVDSSCPKNAPFKRKQENTDILEGPCISCDVPEEIELVNPKGCDRLCPNRTANFVDKPLGFCVLKKCPSDKPFYEEIFGEARCKSCQDEPKHIKIEECAQCPNMRWCGSACVPDRPNIIYYNYSDKVSKYGVYNPLINGGSSPYAIHCNSEEWEHCAGFEMSEQECSRCPFTYMEQGFCYMDGWKQTPNSCPKGTIRNVCGFCISCDSIKGDRFFSEEECEKCPNHKYVDGKCVFTN